MGRAKNTNPCLMGSLSSTWVHSCSLSSSATINSGGNKLYCKCLINCTYLFGSLARVSFISETYLQALLASRLPSSSSSRPTTKTTYCGNSSPTTRPRLLFPRLTLPAERCCRPPPSPLCSQTRQGWPSPSTTSRNAT